MKKFITTVIFASLASSLFAFDKSHLENHLMKALNLTSATKISASDPVPSEFPNFMLVKIMINTSEYPLYVTKDEKKYFWGQVFDLTVDPDKSRFNKINFTDVHSKGSAKAPVTVVEFSDMQCPYCQKAHKTIGESLYKDYRPEQVRLVYKHYPLSMHEWAENAALATECADAQKPGAFWGMSDRFFEKSAEIKQNNFHDMAVQFSNEMKLNLAKFDQCFQARQLLSKVNADKAEGASIGVSATPTFFVNGRMVRGSRFEDLKAVIDEKLKGE